MTYFAEATHHGCMIPSFLCTDGTDYRLIFSNPPQGWKSARFTDRESAIAAARSVGGEKITTYCI